MSRHQIRWIDQVKSPTKKWLKEIAFSLWSSTKGPSIMYENTLFPSYKSLSTCGNLYNMKVVTYPSHYRPITSLT